MLSVNCVFVSCLRTKNTKFKQGYVVSKDSKIFFSVKMCKVELHNALYLTIYS